MLDPYGIHFVIQLDRSLAERLMLQRLRNGRQHAPSAAGNNVQVGRHVASFGVELFYRFESVTLSSAAEGGEARVAIFLLRGEITVDGTSYGPNDTVTLRLPLSNTSSSQTFRARWSSGGLFPPTALVVGNPPGSILTSAGLRVHGDRLSLATTVFVPGLDDPKPATADFSSEFDEDLLAGSGRRFAFAMSEAFIGGAFNLVLRTTTFSLPSNLDSLSINFADVSPRGIHTRGSVVLRLDVLPDVPICFTTISTLALTGAGTSGAALVATTDLDGVGGCIMGLDISDTLRRFVPNFDSFLPPPTTLTGLPTTWGSSGAEIGNVFADQVEVLDEMVVLRGLVQPTWVETAPDHDSTPEMWFTAGCGGLPVTTRFGFLRRVGGSDTLPLVVGRPTLEGPDAGAFTASFSDGSNLTAPFSLTTTRPEVVLRVDIVAPPPSPSLTATLVIPTSAEVLRIPLRAELEASDATPLPDSVDLRGYQSTSPCRETTSPSFIEVDMYLQHTGDEGVVRICRADIEPRNGPWSAVHVMANGRRHAVVGGVPQSVAGPRPDPVAFSGEELTVRLRLDPAEDQLDIRHEATLRLVTAGDDVVVPLSGIVVPSPADVEGSGWQATRPPLVADHWCLEVQVQELAGLEVELRPLEERLRLKTGDCCPPHAEPTCLCADLLVYTFVGLDETAGLEMVDHAGSVIAAARPSSGWLMLPAPRQKGTRLRWRSQDPTRASKISATNSATVHGSLRGVTLNRIATLPGPWTAVSTRGDALVAHASDGSSRLARVVADGTILWQGSRPLATHRGGTSGALATHLDPSSSLRDLPELEKARFSLVLGNFVAIGDPRGRVRVFHRGKEEVNELATFPWPSSLPLPLGPIALGPGFWAARDDDANIMVGQLNWMVAS